MINTKKIKLKYLNEKCGTNLVFHISILTNVFQMENSHENCLLFPISAFQFYFSFDIIYANHKKKSVSSLQNI